MLTRTVTRLVAGLSLAVTLCAPTLVHAQATPNFAPFSIDQGMVGAKLTREDYDTRKSRGTIRTMLGQRVIAYSTNDSQWEFSDGSASPVWAAFATVGSVTLDAAHAAGATITISGSNAPVGIVDAKATSTGALQISSVTPVTGSTVKSFTSITDVAANTSSGAITGLAVDFSGATNSGGGALYGLYANMQGTSDYGLYIANGAAYVDDALTVGGALTVTGAFTMGAITASGASHSFTSTATTGNAFLFTADSLTTGKGLRLVSSAAGFDQAGGGRAISVYDGANQVYDVGIDGTNHIKGTATGTTALLLDAGDIEVTSGTLKMTSGGATLTAGDLTLTAGKATVTPSATSAKGVVIVGGSGARSVSALEYISSGAFSQPQVVFTGSGAFTGDFQSNSISGAASGNFRKTLVGAVAYTGDVDNTDLGATCTTCQAAVYVGGAAARTTPIMQFTDASTGAAADTIAVASANTSSTGAEQRLTESANFAGAGLVVSTDAAAVGAYGIKVSSATRAFTSPLFDVSIGAANTVAPAFLVTQTATGAATGVSHGYSFVSTGTGYLGSAFKGTLGASTGASVLTGTTSGGARTSDLVSLSDAGTSSGNDFSATASAVGSGHLYYGTFSAAGTGNGVNIDMGSNVAGTGVKVLSAATTGVGLSVASTGILASSAAVRNVVSLSATGAWDADTTNASYVLNVAQSTGAGAAGDYAMRVSATGTNVEALNVDDGLSKFDEGITIGVSGVGAGTQKTHAVDIFPDPTTIALYIDGSTSGNRPTHTSGVFNTTVTTATASTVTGQFFTTTSGDRDGVVGVQSSFNSGGLTTATKINSAYKSTITGTGTDTGYFYGYNAAFASSAAGATQIGHGVSGTHDFSFAAIDTAQVTQPVTTSSGVGQTHLVAGGDALTSGDGGALTIRGGNGANAGNGGALILQGGTKAGAGTNSTVVIGIGGTTDKVTYSTAATAAGFGGINTVAPAGVMRPTRVKYYGAQEIYSYTVASAASLNGFATKAFTDAAVGTDIATFAFATDSCVDVSAAITVTIQWTAAAGSGTDTMWKVLYKNIADNGDATASFTSISSTADTLTANNQLETTGAYSVTGATFTAGDLVSFEIERDGAAGGDSSANTSSLVGAFVTYRSLCP